MQCNPMHAQIARGLGPCVCLLAPFYLLRGRLKCARQSPGPIVDISLDISHLSGFCSFSGKASSPFSFPPPPRTDGTGKDALPEEPGAEEAGRRPSKEDWEEDQANQAVPVAA